MHETKQKINFTSLLKPRYWLLWLGIGILWSFAHLPLSWQLQTGKRVGLLFYHFASNRRRIALINIKLCYPELSESQQQSLLLQHFESLGMGLFEMLNAWWISNNEIKSLGCIEGLHHLYAGLQLGKGVILLIAHVTPVELGTRFLTMQTPIHAVYRPHKNPLIEYVMHKNRIRHVEKAIPRNAVREMLRSLKENKTLWLAMDQNFGHKNSVFAPFFKIPTATNTVVTRLAKLSGAAVIPFFTYRLPEGRGYKAVLHPPLSPFPSGDTEQDATHINQLIEQHIRQAPEQYLWVHRRFKDRPMGELDFYS